MWFPAPSDPLILSRRDVVLLGLVTTVMVLLVLLTQTQTDLLSEDFGWYLNRATLLQRGLVSDTAIYTFGYPALMAIVNTLTHNSIASAVLTTTAAVVICVLCLFYLGAVYFDRRVALFAVVLLLSNVVFLDYVRQMQTMPLFTAAVLLNLVIFTQVWRNRTRSVAWALLLGLMVSLSMLVRFEGVIYGILFVLAAAVVYRQRGTIAAIQVLIACSIGFAPLFLTYGYFLLQGTLSSDNSTFVQWMTTQVVDPQAIARTVSDYIEQNVAFLIHMLPLVVWILLAWGVTLTAWSPRGMGLLLGLGVYHAVCLFLILSTYSYTYYLPLLALWVLPMAYILLTLHDQVRLRGSRGWVVPLVLAAVLLTTLTSTRWARPLAFYETPLRGDVAYLDAWIAEQGGATIYTPCSRVLPFTRSDMRMLFRFAGYHARQTLPDSPPQLMPRMAAEGDLLLYCGESSALDWNNVVYGVLAVDGYRLEPVFAWTGASDTPFVLYKVTVS